MTVRRMVAVAVAAFAFDEPVFSGAARTIKSDPPRKVANTSLAMSSMNLSNTSGEQACTDLSGDYIGEFPGGRVYVTLRQAGCSGEAVGIHGNSKGAYTVAGSTLTLDHGLQGIISGAKGSYTIAWPNGITYTQACTDLSGDYIGEFPGGRLSVTLRQAGCSGEVVGIHGSGGGGYTVAGSTATTDNGIQGIISGEKGSYTIAWSIGITYTQKVWDAERFGNTMCRVGSFNPTATTMPEGDTCKVFLEKFRARDPNGFDELMKQIEEINNGNLTQCSDSKHRKRDAGFAGECCGGEDNSLCSGAEASLAEPEAE